MTARARHELSERELRPIVIDLNDGRQIVGYLNPNDADPAQTSAGAVSAEPVGTAGVTAPPTGAAAGVAAAPAPALTGCQSCAKHAIELEERDRVIRSLREHLRAQADVIERLQRANEHLGLGPVRVPTDQEIADRRYGPDGRPV